MCNGFEMTDSGDKGEGWRRRGGDEKASDGLMADWLRYLLGGVIPRRRR